MGVISILTGFCNVRVLIGVAKSAAQDKIFFLHT